MSRTFHHTDRYRKQQCAAKQLPWWKLAGVHSRLVKQQWAAEVRNRHKREMRDMPEDPVLSNPRRISDPWNWY